MARKHHKLGDQGGGVSHVQWLLHNNPYGKFLGPKHIDGQYGVVTAAAVKHAKKMLGYPAAKQTATTGSKLVAYLDGSAKLPAAYKARRRVRYARWVMQTKHSRMLSLAAGAVGYVEGADNHNRFGEWYGMDRQPWCAMFVSWCAWQAGLEFHYSYCPTVVSDARAKRNGLSVCGPKRGAVALFDWQGDGVADHIGICTGGARNGGFPTIEGNTSPSDFSNGGMVKRNVRPVNQVVAFAWIGKSR